MFLLVALAAVLPVRAAIITWVTPVNITADTDVATNGILNYAETWGQNGTTVNGVTFAYDTSKTGDVNVGIAFSGSPTGTDNHGEGVGSAGTAYAGLSAAYQVLVKGTVWANVGTVGTLTLNNLTVSNLYEVQIWENAKIYGKNILKKMGHHVILFLRQKFKLFFHKKASSLGQKAFWD